MTFFLRVCFFKKIKELEFISLISKIWTNS